MMQDFVQQIKKTIGSQMEGMHTAIPGKIVSFDAGKCTATVLPAMKYKKPDGKSIDYPKITGVPVVFQQASAQGATVAIPVKAGDGCLIIVSEKSLDYWMYGQETDTDLSFDLSNAICIPGLFVKGNSAVAAACAANAVVIDAKGTRMTVASGSVTIDAAQVTINGNLKVNGDAVTTGDTVANGISVATHVHTGDSGGTTSPPN